MVDYDDNDEDNGDSGDDDVECDDEWGSGYVKGD